MLKKIKSLVIFALISQMSIFTLVALVPFLLFNIIKLYSFKFPFVMFVVNEQSILHGQLKKILFKIINKIIVYHGLPTGYIIILSSSSTKSVILYNVMLLHAKAHIVQMEKFLILYPLLYAISYMTSKFLNNTNALYDNQFEASAREITKKQLKKENYAKRIKL